MLYALHDDDGQIHQANKLYEGRKGHRKYRGMLRNLGHRFVVADAPGLLPPELWYVDVKGQELCKRPPMAIDVSKTRIKCGTKDSALLTNCPARARFTIHTSGVEIHAGELDATELELFIPVPCVYRVRIECFPYKAFSVDIEAAA